MKFWQKFGLFLTSIVFAGLVSSPALAVDAGDVVMSINPASQSLELHSDQSTKGSVKVSNLGKLSFKVKASVSPYYVANDNYDPDFSSETNQTKLASWIKLDQPEYNIEPGSSVEVKFTVTVPKDTPAGGQYAAIMLAADPNKDTSNAMTISSRLAAILYGHVNGVGLRAEGELVSHSIPGFVTGSEFSVTESIKNTGNVDFRVTHSMTITDFFSNREVVNPQSVDADQQMFAYSQTNVLPDTTRTGILVWKKPPKLGLFTVKQQITYLDQDFTFSRLVFICPIWLVVVSISLVIALIIWLIWKHHSKRKKSDLREL